MFGLGPFCGESDLLTSHRFMSCMYTLICEGGGVPIDAETRSFAEFNANREFCGCGCACVFMCV